MNVASTPLAHSKDYTKSLLSFIQDTGVLAAVSGYLPPSAWTDLISLSIKSRYLTEMAKDTVGAAQCSSSAGEGTRFSTNPQSCIISYYTNISIINVRVVSVLVYVDLSLSLYMCKCMWPCACMFSCICACMYVPICVSVCAHVPSLQWYKSNDIHWSGVARVAKSWHKTGNSEDLYITIPSPWVLQQDFGPY